METEQKTEGVADVAENTGGEVEAENITLSKAEYEKLNQTLGSYKRELKDLKKAKESESKETPKTNQPDAVLEKLERIAFRTSGITHPEDMDLARKTAKKWGMDIDEVLVDEDFKTKLERQQSARANVEATSGVKGGGGTSQAKLSPEYWLAKGTPPTAADIPDRKARVKIHRAMMDNAKNGKKFYNE